MKDLSKDLFNPVSGEDFVQMFNQNYGNQETLQGYATKGTVKDIRGDFAMVDVGLKSEGRVPLKEFGASVPSVGDIIDVFVERYESREGTAVLSYTKARAEKAWKDLEKTVADGVDPEGTLLTSFVAVIPLTWAVCLHLCRHPRLTTNRFAMRSL